MNEEIEISVGDKFLHMGTEVRIMAIAEGYIMARNKGCIPFCESIKDFKKRNLPRAGFFHEWAAVIKDIKLK